MSGWHPNHREQGRNSTGSLPAYTQMRIPKNIPIKKTETEVELSTVTLTTESVRKNLSGLRPDSAAGSDNLHPRLLKEAAYE